MDIESVTEFEGNYQPIEWMAKGHCDKLEFALRLVEQFSLNAALLADVNQSVRHEWRRYVPAPDGFGVVLHDAVPGTRGAFRVTVMDDWPLSTRRERRDPTHEINPPNTANTIPTKSVQSFAFTEAKHREHRYPFEPRPWRAHSRRSRLTGLPAKQNGETNLE